MTDEDIALAVDYPDDPKRWVSELVDLCLIDGEPMRRNLHDWSEHQPWVFGHAGRSRAAKRAAKTRWENKGVMRDASNRIAESEKGNAEKNARMPTRCPDPKSISDPVSDSDSDSDSDSVSDSTPTAPSASHSTPEPMASPVMISIPIVGKDKGAGEYAVTKADIDEWHEAYPGVAIMQQLRNMRMWCVSNPDRRKTKRGALKFITGWLAREQNRGGNGKPLPASNEYKPPYHQPFPREG